MSMSAIRSSSSSSMSLAKLMPGCFSVDAASMEISALASDSRKASENSLYFAVKSQNSNTASYVLDAVNAGAVAVATDDEQIAQQSLIAATYFDEQMSAKVSSVASTFYQNPSQELSVVGITGTNGKTSCCYWLSWLFNQAGIACGQIGTLGFSSGVVPTLKPTGFTTPDPIQTQQLLAECRDANSQAVVMEVSSHGLDQRRVEAVLFRSAIFTNLSQDHLDYHQTMASYLDAKLSLFRRKELCHAIINLDDVYSDNVQAAVSSSVKIYSYSLKNTEATLYFSGIQAVAGGYQVRLHFSGDALDRASSIGSPQQDAKLMIPVFGEYNLSNLLAVSAVALAHSVSFEQLVELLSIIPGVPGRLQQIRLLKGLANTPQELANVWQKLPSVLVDFAHTPDAVSSALSSLRDQAAGRLIVVLGCGGNRDKSKRPLMAKAAVEHSDVQFFTSDNPRTEPSQDILQQMMVGLANEEQESVSVIADRKQAIDTAIRCAKSDDIVAVLGRGHETHQEIMGEKHPFNDAAVCFELLQKNALLLVETDHSKAGQL